MNIRINDILDDIKNNHFEKLTGPSNINYIYNNLLVRIPSDNIKKVIDRKRELNFVKNMKRNSFTTNILYIDKNGYQVQKYISNLENIEKADNSNIPLIAKTIKKFHSQKMNLNAKFCLLQEVSKYIKIIGRENLDNDIIDKYNRFKKEYNIIKKTFKYVVSHNDCGPHNIGLLNNKCIIYDYEYSAMNDINFDIAYFIRYANLNSEQIKLFLSNYKSNYKIDTIVFFINWIPLLNYLWVKINISDDVAEIRRERIDNFNFDNWNLIRKNNINIVGKFDGFCNNNYIFNILTKSYSLRIPKGDKCGIDRYNENMWFESTKNDNNYKEVKYSDNNGLCIQEYDYNKKAINTFNESTIVKLKSCYDNIKEVNCKSLNSFKMNEWARFYLDSFIGISNQKELLIELLKIFDSEYSDIESKFDYTICHNDFHPGNILFNKNSCMIIDFEFVGINDFRFDIAYFLHNINVPDKTRNMIISKFNISDGDQVFNFFDKWMPILYYTWYLSWYGKFTKKESENLNKFYESIKRNIQ